MVWRSSLAVQNHDGGSIAVELALRIELPNATWPQSYSSIKETDPGFYEPLDSVALLVARFRSMARSDCKRSSLTAE